MQDRIQEVRIEQMIFIIRGQNVLLDKDVAILYGVSTGNLNKTVLRNLDRFPEDFSFKLTPDEYRNLIFHFGTSKWGETRKMPRAFTEQGVAMLSSVLRSKRAAQVNIVIMRVFVRLRNLLSTHNDLAIKLAAMERQIKKHNGEIRPIFEAIGQLMSPLERPSRQIGFHPEP